MSHRLSFQQWQYSNEHAEPAIVLPDGCRDVLVIRAPGHPPRILLTAFDLRPREACLPPGTHITGYRLRPGAAVGHHTLRAIAAASWRTPEILGNDLASSAPQDEVILALAQPHATPLSVARQHGVSLRTLQRHFQALRLPPPDYWRLLSRSRHAAGWLALPAPMPLADIAAHCGFSDQAHMTREFMRWFGTTPARLRRQPALLEQLRQPALGNWTGEQISMR